MGEVKSKATQRISFGIYSFLWLGTEEDGETIIEVAGAVNSALSGFSTNMVEIEKFSPYLQM